MPGITITPDSGTQFEAGAAEYNSLDRLTDDSYVIAYRDNNDFNKGKVNVGSRTGTSVTIDEGNAVIFNDNSTDNIEVRSLSSSAFVISFRNVNDTNLEVIAGTVSGTTITLGSSVTIGASGNSTIAILDNSNFVVTNSDGKCYVGSISGTTITLGTAQSLPQAATYVTSVGLNATTFIVEYNHPGYAPWYYGGIQMVVGTVDTANKTISFNASTSQIATIVWNSPTYARLVAFDEYHALLAFGYSDLSYVILWACSIDPATLTITVGAPINTGSPNYLQYALCTMGAYNFLVSYYTTTGTEGEIRSGTLTGDTDIAWDAQGVVIFDNGISAYTTLCALTSTDFILGYKSG